MPFPNYVGGKKRLWTRKKVLDALAEAMHQIKGPLPCLDSKYNKIKKGNLAWPTSSRILSYFHSMGRAWLAAGAAKRRVSLFNVDWTDEEREYVLVHAGDMPLKKIGKHLNRTYGGIRGELRRVGIASRHNQGFMSAAEVSKEYDCSYHRVRAMLASRVLPGRYDPTRNRWMVDPGRISPELEMLLRAPKVTHKSWITDRGDYYNRHGLCRRVVDGKLVRFRREA